jgi:hypothetical protein
MTIPVQVEGFPPLEFEDGTPPEVIQATVKRLVTEKGGGKTSFESLVDEAPMAIAKGAASVGQGVLRGLAAPGDLVNWASRKISPFFTGKEVPPEPGLVDLVKSAPGIYQPKEPWEKYLASGAEGTAGFLPTTKLQALAGLASGLGAQAGENFLGKSMPPEAARALGATAPILASIPGAMMRPGMVRAAQAPLRELGPGGIEAAWTNAKAAENTLGAPAGFWQGSSNQPAISGLAESLMRTEAGAPMRRRAETQLPVGRSTAEEFIAGVSPRGAAQEDANVVLAGGKKVLADANKSIKEITAPVYKAAFPDTVDPSGIREAINQGLVGAQIPGASLGGKATKRLESILAAYAGKQVPVGELRTVANEFRDAAEKASLAGQGTKAKALRIAANSINETILPASETLREATGAYKSLAGLLRDPVVESSWSKMFPETMRRKGLGDWDHFVSAFKGAGPEDIGPLAERLHFAAPGTFPAIVKESWKRDFEAAMKGGRGETPDSLLEAIPEAWAGAKGSQKRAAFDETIAAIAREHGRDPQQVVPAANHVMDSLFIYSRGREGLKRAESTVGEAGENFFTKALQSFGLFYPIRTTGRNISAVVSRRTAEKLADLFTDPSKMDELIALANYGPWTKRFENTLRGGVGFGAVTEVGGNPAQDTGK